MKSNLATWIQGKLGQINDRATASDWAEMEKLIQSQPSLVSSKPWYKTQLGLGGIGAGAVVIAISSILLFNSSNDPQPRTDSHQQPPAEVVVEDDVRIIPSLEEQKVKDNTVQDPAQSTNTESLTFNVEETTDAHSNDDQTLAEESVFERPAQGAQSNQSHVNEDGAFVADNPSEGESAADPQPATDENARASQDEMTLDNGSLVLTDNAHEEHEPREGKEDQSNEGDMSSHSNKSGVEADPTEGINTQASSTLTNVSGGSTTAAGEVGTSTTTSSGSTTSGNNAFVASNESDNSSTDQAKDSGRGAETNEGETNTTSEGASTSGASVASLNDDPSLDNDLGEEESAEEILKDVRNKNAIHWSSAAFANYNYSMGGSEVQGAVLDVQPIGLGAEVRAEWRSWSASFGAAFNNESASFSSSASDLQSTYNAVYWGEEDTIQRQVIDSTWVNLGGGNGYWDVDTSYVDEIFTVLRERQDSSGYQMNSRSEISVQGYRVSMPLMLGKQWDFDRFYIGLEAGPVFTLRSTSYYNKGEFFHSRDAWGTDLMVRTEVGFHLSERVSMFGRVGYRTNLTTIKSLRLQSNQAQSIPVSFGVRYHF